MVSGDYWAETYDVLVTWGLQHSAGVSPGVQGVVEGDLGRSEDGAFIAGANRAENEP